MNRKVDGERDFTLLKRKIFHDTSLDCHQFKDNYLKRRIGVRMRARGMENHWEYMRLLSKDPTEYDNFLKDITINVTQFFRDPQVFQLIEEEIMPLIILNKVEKNRRVIRIWSAGCASGEEPYSLAIIMRELLGEEFDNFILTIQGTDIDQGSLVTARDGKYLPDQVENVKLEYLNRYFQFDGDLYIISEDIKDMVRFRNNDLFSGRKGANFDLVLCRNVLIYFTRDMQKALFKQFYNSLNMHGYLVIGKTETLVGEVTEKFEVINTRERIYKKR